MTTPIKIHRLRKYFGATHAVDDIDLSIPGGALFFLLGPSGCGKTTLLRMIAGFTHPDAGTIHFGPQDITHLAPNERNTGMVFQGYALWPHMTVRQNVAFGLDVRKVPRKEARRRVDDALSSVQLARQADRRINQLSGGQQQRVALARALVIRPAVLLLDEPLSNLDAKLRLTMRESIRQICKQADITGVYVTHDQSEALSMADGIAVLNAGRVIQTGPPRQLYRRPNARFVADFLGETNFITARVAAVHTDHLVLDSPVGPLHAAVFPHPAPKVGTTVTCSIRPEAITLIRERQARPQPQSLLNPTNTFAGLLLDSIYSGATAQVRIRMDPLAPNTPQGFELRAAELNPPLDDPPNRPVHLTIDPNDIVVLDSD